MKKPFLPFVFLALLLTACGGGKPVVNRFYVLEYHREALPNQLEITGHLAGSCLIMTPLLDPAFASHQIALRENTHEIHYFSFNEWANRPEQSLETIMQAYFREFPAFKGGMVTAGGEQSDYAIATHVTRLEVAQVRNDFHARLDLEFRLLDRETNTLLAVHKASREEALAQRDLNLFAATISELFVGELQAFVSKFSQAIPADE